MADENTEIDAEEYELTQSMVMNIARAVRALPLRQVLNAIGRAESVGAILDPTLYRAGAAKMQDFKRLVEALRTFQAEIESQLEKAGVRGG